MGSRERVRMFLERHEPLNALLYAFRQVRSLSQPMSRSIWVVERKKRATLLQSATTTRLDRHPPLFRELQLRLTGSSPRLLSFGCSTGEEAETLADYFPSAIIDAVDINPHCIAVARKRARRAGRISIRFLCGDSPPAEERYDAILCLSVLRHPRLERELPESCAGILSFATAAGLVAALDACVKPGGYLAIWGSNFRISDMPQAVTYRSIPVPGKKPKRGPYYGPDDQRLDVGLYGDYLFQKCP